MYRLVDCPHCNSRSVQGLPDVSAEETARLRASGNDTGVKLTCPICLKDFWVPMQDLYDLPQPQA